MVSKPPITVYPVHPSNLLAKPPGIVAECIVVHTTGGSSTIQQLAAWFGGLNVQQGLRGSTNFGVDRFGVIGMFVDPLATVMPIANGQEAGSTAKVVKENPGISANAYSISVEHLDAGTPGSVTPIQLQNSAWLCAWIWQQFIAVHAWKTGAVLDLDHLLQHQALAPSSRPFCASWPQDRMNAHLAKMATLLAPPKPEPEPTPPPPDDWQYRFAALADEANQWNVDDTKHAEASAILRADRIQQIARGDV